MKTNNFMNSVIRSGGKDYGDVIFRYKDGILRPMKAKSYKIPAEILERAYNRKANKYDEARFYTADINPDDFLELTTTKEQLNEIINDNIDRKFVLDLDTINQSYMFLQVNMRTGKVIGHEGRHRMLALKNAGYKKAQILIFPEYGTYKDTEYKYMTFKNQMDDNKNAVIIERVIPVNEEYMKNKRKK